MFIEILDSIKRKYNHGHLERNSNKVEEMRTQTASKYNKMTTKLGT